MVSWFRHLALAETIGDHSAVFVRDPLDLPFHSNAPDVPVFCTQPLCIVSDPTGLGAIAARLPEMNGPEANSLRRRKKAICTSDVTDLVQSTLHQRPVVVFDAEHGIRGNAPGLENVVGSDAFEHSNVSREPADALQWHSRRGRFLRGVTFRADGSADVWLDPVACVRGLNFRQAVGLAAAAAVRLDRWKPWLLRLPTFGDDEVEVTIIRTRRRNGAEISVSSAGNVQRLSIAENSADPDHMTLKVTPNARTHIGIQVAGHGVLIDRIAIRLSAFGVSANAAIPDPLAVFEADSWESESELIR